MSMVVRVLLVAALILSIIVPFGAYFLGEKSHLRATASSSLEPWYWHLFFPLAEQAAYRLLRLPQMWQRQARPQADFLPVSAISRQLWQQAFPVSVPVSR